MALYNPKLTISAAPGVTGYLYLVLYEASSPLSPVANSGQLAPPHNSSRQIQFTGLNPVIHIGKLFETDGSSTTGTVLANFSLDPQFSSFEVRPDLFIYGGDTEGFDVGSNVYADPADSLDGWDYSLEVNGTTLDPATEYSVDEHNNPTIQDGTNIAGGEGFSYQVYEGEKWVFHFKPRLVAFTDTPQRIQLFNTTEVITADRTLTVDDVGKNFIVASDTSAITITLPLLADIPENRQMFFLSDGGSHINAKFITQGSDDIWYLYDRSAIILGQGETLQLYKYGGKYRVSNDLPGVRDVGQFVYTYQTTFINSLFADGSLVSRSVYARLWEYVSTQLSPSQLVSDAVWFDGSNYGRYSTGDGSTTFRVPALRNFQRGVDGVIRTAGDFSEMSIQQINVPVPQGNSFTGPGPAGRTGRGGVNPNTFNITIGSPADETKPKDNGVYIGIKI